LSLLSDTCYLALRIILKLNLPLPPVVIHLPLTPIAIILLVVTDFHRY